MNQADNANIQKCFWFPSQNKSKEIIFYDRQFLRKTEADEFLENGENIRNNFPT